MLKYRLIERLWQDHLALSHVMKFFPWLIFIKIWGKASCDAMAWKRLLHHWTFVSGIYRFAHKEPMIRNFTVEQTIELSVIWVALCSSDVTDMDKEISFITKISLLTHWSRIISRSNGLSRAGAKLWKLHENSASMCWLTVPWWPYCIVNLIIIWPTRVARHDDVIKWEHFPRYWPFARGIHRWPVNSPSKGQWRGALMFSLIGAWINGWVNNREAGVLRHCCAHYDVAAMDC